MTGRGRAWAAGEEAMESLAPEGGLFARLDPVRAGPRKQPPPMGSERYPAIADAPGTYIRG
jgi:hypothetical protein